MRDTRPYADDETRRLSRLLQKHCHGVFRSEASEWAIDYFACAALRLSVCVRGHEAGVPFGPVVLPVGFDDRRALLLLREATKNRAYDVYSIPRP